MPIKFSMGEKSAAFCLLYFFHMILYWLFHNIQAFLIFLTILIRSYCRIWLIQRLFLVSSLTSLMTSLYPFVLTPALASVLSGGLFKHKQNLLSAQSSFTRLRKPCPAELGEVSRTQLCQLSCLCHWKGWALIFLSSSLSWLCVCFVQPVLALVWPFDSAY